LDKRTNFKYMRRTIKALITIIAFQSVLMLAGCQKENTPKNLEEIFHFVALEDGLQVSMELTDEHYPHPHPSLQYSVDGRSWHDFNVGQSVVTLPQAGDKLYMKAKERNATFTYPMDDPECQYIANGYSFKLSKKTKVCGNIMYLLDGKNPEDAEMGQWAFYGLFMSAGLLMDASELLLPAKRLTSSCYSEMFEGTSISKSPELPASEIAEGCYSSMFIECHNLTAAPELPATKMETSCYNGMFMGCSSLIEAPKLPAEQLAIGCYSFMFSGCTSLKTAPKLPAAQLETLCYFRMFEDCTSLMSLTCLGTDLSAERCVSKWMDGVTTAGTLHAASGIDWTGKIPSTWTVEY